MDEERIFMTDLGICLMPQEAGIPRALFPQSSAKHYIDQSRAIRLAGGRFLGLWARVGPPPAVYSAFILREGMIVLSLFLVQEEGHWSFPTLSLLFPAAIRFERTIYDLYGYRAIGLDDTRPWVNHSLWTAPPNEIPSKGEGEKPDGHPKKGSQPPSDYPFVQVSGPGVHEIPVGPVHAGIIEPGHFRFQVVGEKVLRLEERLGYTHKGIEKLFCGRTISEGALLAGRISGDSTTAFAFAYAQAVENALKFTPSTGVRFMRSLLLERERIANHLGDLGALGNDAGLAFALSQFSRLKENMVRMNRKHFGTRYLFDLIVPGGVTVSLGEEAIADLLGETDILFEEVQELKKIFDDHGGLQDRFQNTGILSPDQALKMGLGGVIGRASGQAWDLRIDHGWDPYRRFPPAMALFHTGDVAARVSVRFLEILESLLLSRAILEHIPEHSILEHLPEIESPVEGVGVVEGFRGEIVAWVRIKKNGCLEGAHLQDPSAVLWPALEVVVPGNLVADFPLINKSFNLSYSGNDL